MINEIWKDVVSYEGLYQVSNLGKVKSLERYVSNGVTSVRLIKERILKPYNDKGYIRVMLNGNMRNKSTFVHKIVAESFLGHKVCGHDIVVDHIDNNKLNNHLSNLQLISHRLNGSKDRFGSSIYTGVHWSKKKGKWISQIGINKKMKHLGYFKNEYDAHLAYKNALKQIES